MQKLGSLDGVDGSASDWSVALRPEGHGHARRHQALGPGDPRSGSRRTTSSAEPRSARARRRVERDGCVVFEPWLRVEAEVGLQFHLPESGRPEIVGVVHYNATPPMSADPGAGGGPLPGGGGVPTKASPC